MLRGDPLLKDFDGWMVLSGKFVDGGVIANNPTTAAISFLQKLFPGVDASRTAVLSLGCGSSVDHVRLPASAGQLGAVRGLINIMLGANCDTAAAAGEQMFRRVSCRVVATDSLHPENRCSHSRIAGSRLEKVRTA